MGDVTDASSVEKGLSGCEAVVHAASIYSFDTRDSKLMGEVNVDGTETVLAAAAKHGVGPVVYVSSLGVFYSPGGAVLDERSPITDPRGAYYRSKADAERIARAHQARGAPIAITYPGGVFGPDDPHFGENARIVASVLKRQLPAAPRGGLSIVDVRDLAQAHATLLEAEGDARRYVLSGRHLPFSSFIAALAQETGRRIPHLSLPAWSLRPAVRATSFLQRFSPLRLPFNIEGFDSVTWDPHGDDSRARADLGFEARPTRETLVDTVEWLYRTGRVSAAQAGKVATA